MQILKNQLIHVLKADLNAGQSCISAKDSLLENIYDKFLITLKNNLSKKIIGDPKDDVDIGPMVSIEAREEVHAQVLKSIEKGADLILEENLIWKELLSNHPTFKC